MGSATSVSSNAKHKGASQGIASQGYISQTPSTNNRSVENARAGVSQKDDTDEDGKVPLREGEVDIGIYRVTLTEDLGSGTFGSVYKAINRKTKEMVAVKKIRYTFGNEINNKMKDMAVAEAESMKMVSHPHIVSLLDYHTGHGSAWLFMPFCDLGDMNMYLKNNPSMTLEKRCTIMYQVTSGVYHLHMHSPPIIHRDIKPGNVLVQCCDGKETAMLTDFGFAKLIDYSLSASGSAVYQKSHDSLIGTPSYMAPEFFLEDETRLKYTATVDIFSLGLLDAVILDYGPENKSTHPLSGKWLHNLQVLNYPMNDLHRTHGCQNKMIMLSKFESHVQVALYDFVTCMLYHLELDKVGLDRYIVSGYCSIQFRAILLRCIFQ